GQGMGFSRLVVRLDNEIVGWCSAFPPPPRPPTRSPRERGGRAPASGPPPPSARRAAATRARAAAPPSPAGRVDAPRRSQAQPLPYRVTRRQRETSDVWTLGLEPLAGDRIRPSAGQFTMLTAPGVGEVATSVSGDPQTAGPLLQTIRAVGHVTNALCAARLG